MCVCVCLYILYSPTFTRLVNTACLSTYKHTWRETSDIYANNIDYHELTDNKIQVIYETVKNKKINQHAVSLSAALYLELNCVAFGVSYF